MYHTNRDLDVLSGFIHSGCRACMLVEGETMLFDGQGGKLGG